MGAVAARGWLNASMARQNQVVARLVSAMMKMMAVVWSVAISVEMVSSNGVDGSVGCLPFERRQMAIRGVGRGCRSVRARLPCVRALGETLWPRACPPACLRAPCAQPGWGGARAWPGLAEADGTGAVRAWRDSHWA